MNTKVLKQFDVLDKKHLLSISGGAVVCMGGVSVEVDGRHKGCALGGPSPAVGNYYYGWK